MASIPASGAKRVADPTETGSDLAKKLTKLQFQKKPSDGQVYVGANLPLSYDFGKLSSPSANSPKYLSTHCPYSYDPYRRSRRR